MATVLAGTASNKERSTKATRLVGWQGFTVRVPEAWDLTGFSGDDAAGYLRIDDGTEQSVEVKWGTEPKKAKNGPPDVEVRRESYFRALKKTAKKKKIALETRDSDAPRGVARPDRAATGFQWLGDRKAVGAVWHCRTCRRTVIAQVLGDRSGRGGLSRVAEEVLASLRCHPESADGWRTWALYDLVAEVPPEWTLTGQELMNVYLRLQFAHKTARLVIEQWSLANVARRDAFLDVWLQANSKGPVRQARFIAGEGEAHGHATLDLDGGPNWGRPMAEVAREVLRFQRPATRFRLIGWECAPSNKLFAVSAWRRRTDDDLIPEVAARVRCHGDGEVVGAP